MINSLKLIFLDSFCKKVVNVFQAKSGGSTPGVFASLMILELSMT